jgi:hypothetical protein
MTIRELVFVNRAIEMLRVREEGMRGHIHKAVSRGNEEDRVHYVGWLRGIQGSRTMLEYLLRREEEET